MPFVFQTKLTMIHFYIACLFRTAVVGIVHCGQVYIQNTVVFSFGYYVATVFKCLATDNEEVALEGHEACIHMYIVGGQNSNNNVIVGYYAQQTLIRTNSILVIRLEIAVMHAD